MKYFIPPTSTVSKAMALGLTLSLLSGCSSSDNDAETLAQNADSFAPVTSQTETNPYASRNNGAWGAVYMNEKELNETDRRIVDYNEIPKFSEDTSLTEWNEKFDAKHYATTDGKKLYHDSCAGCHMHEGEGAISVGYYPPLADNPKMASKYYIIDILINGFRGMPSFRHMLNDEQMAAVTQYVMDDLNGYKEEVTASDVNQLRPVTPPVADPYD